MSTRRGEPKKWKFYTPFDYNKTKRRYLKAIDNYEILRLWREEVFTKIREEIKAAKGAQTQYSQKYEVFRNDKGVDVLILHRYESPKIIECISAEDSFDVFVDVHQTTGHGGKEKMLQNLRQRYHVSTACLKIFLELCNVCKRKRTEKKAVDNTPKNLGHTVIVSILDLVLQEDGDFGYILVYKFKWSGFTLLRPITISNFEQDLTMELLNIFLDFGPPVKISADLLRLDTISKAISNISTLTCDCNVLVEKEMNWMMDSANFAILKAIQDWMIHSKSNHWSLACHLIQWKINNSGPIEMNGNRDCPQKIHFNKPSAQSEDVSKSAEEEEILTVVVEDDEDDDDVEETPSVPSPMVIEDEPGPSKEVSKTMPVVYICED